MAGIRRRTLAKPQDSLPPSPMDHPGGTVRNQNPIHRSRLLVDARWSDDSQSTSRRSTPSTRAPHSGQRSRRATPEPRRRQSPSTWLRWPQPGQNSVAFGGTDRRGCAAFILRYAPSPAGLRDRFRRLPHPDAPGTQRRLHPRSGHGPSIRRLGQREGAATVHRHRQPQGPGCHGRFNRTNEVQKVKPSAGISPIVIHYIWNCSSDVCITTRILDESVSIYSSLPRPTLRVSAPSTARRVAPRRNGPSGI